MAVTKRLLAASLCVVAMLAVGSAYFVSDTSGAHLELAPIFVGAAVFVASVWMLRSRSGRGRR